MSLDALCFMAVARLPAVGRPSLVPNIMVEFGDITVTKSPLLAVADDTSPIPGLNNHL